MQSKAQATSKLLIYFGLVPFVGLVLANFLGLKTIEPIGEVDRAFAYYCFGISSFMAGSHWGFTIACKRDQLDQSMMLLSATLLVLLPFVCLTVFGATWVFYVIQIVAFLKLFAIDRSLYLEAILEKSYYQDRKLATLIVVASLSLIILQELL